MQNIIRSNFQAHPFHLVSPSPWLIWPFIISIIILLFMVVALAFENKRLHYHTNVKKQNNLCVLVSGFVPVDMLDFATCQTVINMIIYDLENLVSEFLSTIPNNLDYKSSYWLSPNYINSIIVTMVKFLEYPLYRLDDFFLAGNNINTNIYQNTLQGLQALIHNTTSMPSPISNYFDGHSMWMPGWYRDYVYDQYNLSNKNKFFSDLLGNFEYNMSFEPLNLLNESFKNDKLTEFINSLNSTHINLQVHMMQEGSADFAFSAGEFAMRLRHFNFPYFSADLVRSWFNQPIVDRFITSSIEAQEARWEAWNFSQQMIDLDRISLSNHTRSLNAFRAMIRSVIDTDAEYFSLSDLQIRGLGTFGSDILYNVLNIDYTFDQPRVLTTQLRQVLTNYDLFNSPMFIYYEFIRIKIQLYDLLTGRRLLLFM